MIQNLHWLLRTHQGSEPGEVRGKTRNQNAQKNSDVTSYVERGEMGMLGEAQAWRRRSGVLCRSYLGEDCGRPP